MSDLEKFAEWIKAKVIDHIEEIPNELDFNKPFEITFKVEFDGKKTHLEQAAYNKKSPYLVRGFVTKEFNT